MSNQILRARRRRNLIEELTIRQAPEYQFMKRKLENAMPDAEQRLLYLETIIKEMEK